MGIVVKVLLWGFIFSKYYPNRFKNELRATIKVFFHGPAGPYGTWVGVYGVPFGYPEMSQSDRNIEG